MKPRGIQSSGADPALFGILASQEGFVRSRKRLIIGCIQQIRKAFLWFANVNRRAIDKKTCHIYRELGLQLRDKALKLQVPVSQPGS